MSLPNMADLKQQANEHILEHSHEIVILLDEIGVGLTCPYLYAALLELAYYIKQGGTIGAYEDYQPEGLIEQFRQEHTEELLQETALGATIDEIDEPTKINPTIIH